MYGWLVTLHVIGVFVFLLCHGVSMWVAFRIRGERDRRVITTLLAMSGRGSQAMYLGLVLMGLGGMAAAWSAGLLLAPWVVASYVVVAITLVGMYAVGAAYYIPLRAAIAGSATTAPLDDAELQVRLATRRPEALAGIGMVSLGLLAALMTLKPG